MAKEDESFKSVEEVTKVIDKYFPKGDPRRGDAMVVAGISHIAGREEMRKIILKKFERKYKDE